MSRKRDTKGRFIKQPTPQDKQQEMIEAGEIYIDDNGDLTWSAKSDRRAGSFAAQPQSAPLLTPERAAVLNAIKNDRREVEFDNALIRAAEAFTGERIDNVEKAHGIMLEAVATKGLTGNVAAAKLAFQMTGAMPQEAAGQTNIETQNVLQINNIPHYNPDYISDIVKDAPDYARTLLETANWAGREELKSQLQEELSASNNSIPD